MNSLIAVALAHRAHPANLWPGAAIPFLMLAGGVALVMFGRYFARDGPPK
jgi:hypothetical protein